MVQINDNSARLRKESYEHINELINPEYYLKCAGTGTDIYYGPATSPKIVGQWDKHNGTIAGHLWLYWDNIQVTITGNPEQFMKMAEMLEEHSYRVTIEV